VPELPETETIARDLSAAVAGLQIQKVDVARPDVLRGATAAQFRRRQAGKRLGRVWRRAKTVVLDLDGGDRLLVTPRFTGSLQLRQPRDDYTAIEWLLSDGGTLAYRDVRRLGTVALVSPAEFEAFDRRLGLEPLSPAFTPAALKRIVGASRAAVKKTLMDQRQVAGIGNIYANESLWRAGIDPSREARGLTPGEVARLHREILDVLTASVAARGTTFRDYRDAHNERGAFAEQLQAYGRGGQPCRRCARRLLETHVVDGRSTVMCCTCQR
jgi:formamidopyrimidine-DNA glycosylase